MEKENISAYVGIFLIAAVLSVIVFSALAPISAGVAGRVITGNSTGSQQGRSGTYTTNSSVPVSTTTIAQTSAKAFQNGKVVNYVYSNETCTPLIYNTSEAQNASAVTRCEVGGSFGANIVGAIPIWSLIPSFAGPSIYGVFSGYPASQQGYPIYNGNVLVTQCGIGNSASACAGRPVYFYSPSYSRTENNLGITSGGINGLPRGVLPNAGRDFIMSPSKSGVLTKSYIIRVGVFDPNIYPNATTGKCTVVAPSSLANPTGNCLTSLAALMAAVNTSDNAIATINANNLLWNGGTKTTMQAEVTVIVQNPGTPVTYTTLVVSNVLTPNTDQTSFSFITNTTTVATTVSTTLATTTVPQVSAQTTVPNSTIAYPSMGGSSTTTYVVVAIVVIVIIVIVVWAMMRRKK